MLPVVATATENIEIGIRLAALRHALGLSQVKLASRLNLGDHGAQRWNNWEKGRDRIPVDNATQLCTVSGATLDYIYRGIEAGLPLSLAGNLPPQPRLKPPRRA